MEVEATCKGEPLPALPPSDHLITDAPFVTRWSYGQGELTQVEILGGSERCDYALHDVTNDRFLSAIPADAFDIVDSEAPNQEADLKAITRSCDH